MQVIGQQRECLNRKVKRFDRADAFPQCRVNSRIGQHLCR